MSANHIRNMAQRQKLETLRSEKKPPAAMFANVAGYDPKTNAVRVTIENQYDDQGLLPPTEIGWIPFLTSLMAGGSGEQTAPPIGAQVVIVSMGQDGDEWCAIGMASTAQNQPPFNAMEPGEWGVANPNDPTVAIYVPSSTTDIQLGALAGMLTGNPNRVLREKDLYPLITAMNTAVSKFNAHVHPGVQAGSSSTTATTTPMATYTNPAGSTTIRGGD